jgi:hypothetical protein
MAGGNWMNDDGLYIKYGRSEGTSTHPAGIYAGSLANEQVLEVTVDVTVLTQTETILNDAVWIPANAHVTKVEVVCLEAWATGTAIDLGLIDQDRSTEINYDGFLAAFEDGDQAAPGETRVFFEDHTVPASTTGTGALVGQEVTNTGYVSASITDATAFTTGKSKVRIYFVPKGLDITG